MGVGSRPSSEINSASDRITTRTFPSIFQGWNPAENLNKTISNAAPIPTIPLNSIESSTATLARHDLLWHVPSFYHLAWSNRQYQGLSTDFTAISIPLAQKMRADLLAANPHMIILAEIRYHDGPQGYLPDDSPWWLRDSAGNRIPANKTISGAWYNLDYSNPDFQDLVAKQCLAVMQTQAFDGCMFDWWYENAGRLQLIQKVRNAVGSSAIIVANVNGYQPAQTGPYINGTYMEGMLPKANGGLYDWHTAAANLLWAANHLKQPSFTALDAWYEDPSLDATSLGRNNVSLMRFTTTLSLTHSDGYVLFGDPNSLPTGDHLHDWYPFWNRSLGRPTGPLGQTQADGSFVRTFDNGVAICNPPENVTVKVHFDSIYASQTTGESGTDFSVPPGDGDIFLKAH